MQHPFMGSCMFVASGLSFDVDAYLRSSPFKNAIAAVFRKGQVPPKGNPQKIARPDSGFVHIVSDTQEPQIQNQIPEVLRFLATMGQEFQRLKALGVDNMLFDFGMEQQQTIQRAHYLPPELISAMSRYEMGLMFSTVVFPKG